MALIIKNNIYALSARSRASGSVLNVVAKFIIKHDPPEAEGLGVRK